MRAIMFQTNQTGLNKQQVNYLIKPKTKRVKLLNKKTTY